MIYPILSIDPNNVTTMDLIDTEFDEGPFLSVTDVDAPAIFFNLLSAFINQYNCGYNDAIDDRAFGDEYIFE